MLLWLLACTRYDCEPAPQVDGSRSGFEACRKTDATFAYVDRVDAVACSGDPLATIPACTHPESGECSGDKDCAEGEACGAAQSGYAECGCWPVCASDAECEADEACVCALEVIPSGAAQTSDVYAAVADHCVPAKCRTGADCESGECGALIGPCGDAILGFYCRTREDECRSNNECGNIGWCGSTGGKWTCASLGNCD